MRILSLGAGVQSSTLAFMAESGHIDPIDCAIFSDTGAEPQRVYKWLEYMRKTIKSYPIYVVSRGNLKEDLEKYSSGEISRVASVPFFTETETTPAPGMRQCTPDYKITPVHNKIRELHGLKPRQRAKGVIFDEFLMGISMDEVQRIKPSGKDWLFAQWPLIDLRMTRQDCLDWMAENGYPTPPESSCTFCPYHSNELWQDLKDNAPEEFAEAVELDKKIRNGGEKFIKERFMHRSLKPLDQIDFKALKKTKRNDFNNECSGMCNT